MAKKLRTLTDVRRYLSSLIQRVENGEIDLATSGRLTSICSVLLSCIKDSELEPRIAALEKQLKRERK